MREMSGNYTSFFMLVAFISHRPRRKLTSKQMEFLLRSTGKGVLDLVRFADSKVECGATKKRKFILPGKKGTRKWFMNAFHAQEGATDLAPDHAEAGISVVYLGALYQKRKDPEHLPPSSMLHMVPLPCSNPRTNLENQTPGSVLETISGQSPTSYLALR